MNIKIKTGLLTGLFMAMPFTIFSQQTIKAVVQVNSANKTSENGYAVVTFQHEKKGFWHGDYYVYSDTLIINETQGYYYVNENAFLNIQLPDSIIAKEIVIFFYSMSEMIEKQRGRWKYFHESDIELLFEKSKKNGLTLRCKVPLKDLFYYQSYMLPYARKEGFISYQLQFSDDDLTEKGICLTVLDDIGQPYKIYKHFYPQNRPDNIYTFEFFKGRLLIDYFKLEFRQVLDSITAVTIENISMTDGILTRNIKNFTIQAGTDSITSRIASYPYNLPFENQSVNSNYHINVHKFGISWARRDQLKKHLSIGFVSLLILFFTNRMFFKRQILFKTLAREKFN